MFTAPVFSALSALASYGLMSEVKSEGAGLLAALFVGIVPSYISRSVAGSYDNEGVAIFALIFVFYLFVKVRWQTTGKQERMWLANKRQTGKDVVFWCARTCTRQCQWHAARLLLRISVFLCFSAVFSCFSAACCVAETDVAIQLSTHRDAPSSPTESLFRILKAGTCESGGSTSYHAAEYAPE